MSDFVHCDLCDSVSEGIYCETCDSSEHCSYCGAWEDCEVTLDPDNLTS